MTGVQTCALPISRALLERVELGRDVEWGADGHDEPADLERVDPTCGDEERRVVEGGIVPTDPRNHELRDLLSRGQGVKQGVDGGGGGGGTAVPPCRRTARGTPNDDPEYQEPMRAHHLAVYGLLTAAFSRPATAQVRPGIEVLLADSQDLVRGKRVGLLTNPTGVDRAGHRDVDVLLTVDGVRLMALFSPEHGFRGTEDRPGIPDAVDSATGLPIYSLYAGVPARALAALDSIDAVVIDLQDIGARYYTYVSTAVALARDAAGRGKPVVVLDRPNPIGGEVVQGNVRATAGDPVKDFVGFLPVPMRHGMTLGELMLLANDTLRIHADLTIVPAAGWRRNMYYDNTRLPWVRPSPNMPDLESALHYPGICLFEGTNLSVGRGTPVAFQVIGAPWLDADAVLRWLQEQERARGKGKGEGLAGVEVAVTTFMPRGPTDFKYDGVELRGIRLRVVDRGRYDPTRAAVLLLSALRAVHPDSFRISSARFDRLAAGPELRQAIQAGRAPSAIWRSWGPGLARFRRARAKYLLY